MPAGTAYETASADVDLSTFHQQTLGIDEAISHFLMRCRNDVPESLPGNVHLFRSMFLVQAIIIGKPNGFEFIEGECN
jgi:hypothetical protein